jgi:hypothetical protein
MEKINISLMNRSSVLNDEEIAAVLPGLQLLCRLALHPMSS